MKNEKRKKNSLPQSPQRGEDQRGDKLYDKLADEANEVFGLPIETEGLPQSPQRGEDRLSDEANEVFGLPIETEINPHCLEYDGNPQSSPYKGDRGGPCGTCKRNFWTQVLRTVTKVASIVLAAFGLSSFVEDD